MNGGEFRKRQRIAVLPCVAWIVLSISPCCAGEWMTDLSVARQKARERQLPILLHFYRDACPPCRIMDREVLHAPQLTDLFGNRLIAVRINTSRYPRLVRHYRITGIPCDIFLNVKGQEVARRNGYETGQGREYLSAVMRFQQEQQVAARPIAIPESQNIKDPVSRPQAPPYFAADDPDLVPLSPIPTESPRQVVGMDSYSPVALWNFRQWRRGSHDFTATFQGVTFCLVDEDELAQFQSEPARYAPRLLGCDPVILENTDRAVEGSTRYAAYFDGGLFLFASEQNRQRFKKSPLRFTRTRHAIRLDHGKRIAETDGSSRRN